MPRTLEARDGAQGLKAQGGLKEGAVAGGKGAATCAVELSSTVPARPASIAFVRNAIRGFADSWRKEGWGPESFDAERSADLALVFTELLTNAVVHSGCGPDEALEVRLALESAEIHGAVIDPGKGFSAQPGSGTPRVDGGLGLFIVGRLVRVWGVRVVPAGNEVWFEL